MESDEKQYRKGVVGMRDDEEVSGYADAGDRQTTKLAVCE